MFLAGSSLPSIFVNPILTPNYILALAHQYSFPYKPFQINDQPTNSDWTRKILAMLDMEDVRQDLSEHFGVVGNRIATSFRSQPTYLQYSEADYLITPSQAPTQVVAVSRVNNKNYGTYKASKSSDKSQAIGKDNKKYRIADIEDKESPQSGQPSSSRNNTTNSNMTQSTASTSSSSFGINVRGLENDPINYRNPDV